MVIERRRRRRTRKKEEGVAAGMLIPLIDFPPEGDRPNFLFIHQLSSKIL
jgi:hypothetical protein